MKCILVILFTMLLIFSCKKEDEQVDPCQNGFLDAGEQSPDCGGNCPPCDENFISSLYLKINGISTSFSSKSLSYTGTNWILSMSNDTIDINLDFGTNGNIGSYVLSNLYSNCDYFGINYPVLNDANFAISYHDTINNRMSGFFQAKFSRPGFVDTIRITNGQFDYYIY